MRWAWATTVALLWPQLMLLGGVRARREPKRPRQPGQRLASLNATMSSSEGLPGFPKVCVVWAHVGAPLPPIGSAPWLPSPSGAGGWGALGRIHDSRTWVCLGTLSAWEGVGRVDGLLSGVTLSLCSPRIVMPAAACCLLV